MLLPRNKKNKDKLSKLNPIHAKIFSNPIGAGERDPIGPPIFYESQVEYLRKAFTKEN